MRAARRDRLVGSALLAFAVAWTATAYVTIPSGFSDNLGPRAFPLGLGGALIVLSALLLVSGFRQAEAADDEDEEREAAEPNRPPDLKTAGAVFVVIVAYGFLMEKAGFLIATPVVVTATMVLLLRVRRPVPVAAMAAGITFGCWLVFGKLLGAYLPPGSWL